ncbi:hypothetical protein FJZ41_01480 [Candidatus Shapirobacteria bacterium]|nr:hypothetical protein [Candidatus Shapirobacteria bacterium]
MVQNLLLIISWWLPLFLLGLIFLPLIFFFFPKFFDRGYALAKILGILILSYLTWFLGSLKILPFEEKSLYFLCLFLIIINFLFLKIFKINFKKILKEKWRLFVLEEVLFLACLSFWSWVRGFQPGIHGLEKFMDFGFVNSILKTQFFPPADMWLSGQTINYYYFGHLVSAVLTKLSGLSSTMTYNLMIATLFAFTFGATFSLAGSLVFTLTPRLSKKTLKRVLGLGFLAAFFLTLGGNFHSLYWFLTHQFSFVGYWYPDATRFIVEQFGAADNTIHEFPIYSFVVADLHGHLINLPFVLLFLALIFSLFINKKFLINKWQPMLGYLILPALLLGTFYMTNAWDFPIYFLIICLIILLANYQKEGLTLQTFLKTLTWSVGLLVLAFVFSLPFHLHFRSITSGLGLTDFRSPPWMLLVLWGFPLLMTLVFLSFLKKLKLVQADFFILILLFVSWFLIIVPEFFYLKDIYIHSYQRANTMFKLTYQSFVMFCLTTGYLVFRLLNALKKQTLKSLFILIFLFFSFFIFIYPYFAIRSYYGLKDYQGLDGLKYLQTLYPDDYQGILWLKENLTGQPVVLEAVGESYTDFGRVSANTGLPTILGWRVHEWLWRGSFDEAGKRTEEVKTIYEGEDLTQAQELLKKYQVEFIFLGTLERQAYPELKENQLTKLGKVVFQSGPTKILQLNP